MSNSSCYVCKHSVIEEKTGYLVCRKHFFERYVQPCNVCELFEHEVCQKTGAYIDQEEEIEIEITVVDDRKD